LTSDAPLAAGVIEAGPVPCPRHPEREVLIPSHSVQSFWNTLACPLATPPGGIRGTYQTARAATARS
jgi:hypothetical protein